MTPFEPFELAFLDGTPNYEQEPVAFEQGSVAFEQGSVPVVGDEEQAPVGVPSPERRAAALRLFYIIGGSAVLVLVLALLRLLWGALAS